MIKKTDIDLKLFSDHYDTKMIKELKKDYFEMINTKRPTNFNYFSNLGTYSDRNNGIEEVADYFERLLYAPNIAVLDYVLKNKSHFKDLYFIDSGSGFGLLSIFLQEIGIKCYNYDNFSQLQHLDDPETWPETFYQKYKIMHPSPVFPKDDIVQFQMAPYFRPVNALNVLVACGIGVGDQLFNTIKFDYLFLDPGYGGCIDMEDYTLIETYEDGHGKVPLLMRIYKRISK